MAITTLTGLKPEWFEPEKEHLENAETVLPVSGFYIKPLTGIEYHDLLSYIGSDGKLSADGIKVCLQYALKDWRYINDELGNRVDFSVDAALQVVPAKYLILISSRVFELSSFDGESEKN